MKSNRVKILGTNEVKNYPSWEHVNCDCCGGLQQNKESPIVCPVCKGYSFYVKHIKSGVMACYPGGPFLGRE